VEKAKEQLTASLKWRKEYQPLKVKDEAFDADKFGKLGYVTRVKGATETKNEEDVAAFNIYGAAAKDFKKTFGDTDAFVRWRVALMEITIAQLNLHTADKVIPDYGKGPDPYKAIAVHDYLSVSFLRQPAEIKASSSKIVDMFQRYYPETVSYKYFVNVPLVMQWMMGAMKLLLSKDSVRTMTWMTSGSELHKYLGPNVPKEYGGTGPPLSDVGITTNFGIANEAPKSSPAVVPEATAELAAEQEAESSPVAEPAATTVGETAEPPEHERPVSSANTETGVAVELPNPAPETAGTTAGDAPEVTSKAGEKPTAAA
jgi:hypothetical protein